MNVIDIVFIAILLVLTVRGMYRGLLRELASIAAIVLGFALANRYHQDLEPFMASWFSLTEHAALAAYVAIFALTALALLVATRLAEAVVRIGRLSTLDHLTGGLFGFAKGFILCAAILLGLQLVMPDAAFLRNSRIAPFIADGAALLAQHLPKDLREALEQGKKGLESIRLPL